MICWECVFIKHDICQDRWCQRTLTLQFKMLSTSTILMKCEWHPSVLVYLRNCTISVRARQALFTINITSAIVVCYGTVYTSRQPFIYKFRFRLWILFFHFCILWRFYIKLWVNDIKIRKNISPFYAFKGLSKTEHNTLFFLYFVRIHYNLYISKCASKWNARAKQTVLGALHVDLSDLPNLSRQFMARISCNMNQTLFHKSKEVWLHDTTKINNQTYLT